MSSPALASDPEPHGMIRLGGGAMVAAAVVVILFVILVVVNQQELPVPPRQALEDPFLPSALYVFAAIGEFCLLPGFVALYLMAKHGSGRTPMMMALVFTLVSVPMFILSRLQIVAIAQMADAYRAATSTTLQEAYLIAAELGVETQNMASTGALLLLCAASVAAGISMLHGAFPRWVAYIAIAAGVFTVFSPFAVMMGIPVIVPFLGLILMGIWQITAGILMIRI